MGWLSAILGQEPPKGRLLVSGNPMGAALYAETAYTVANANAAKLVEQFVSQWTPEAAPDNIFSRILSAPKVLYGEGVALWLALHIFALRKGIPGEITQAVREAIFAKLEPLKGPGEQTSTIQRLAIEYWNGLLGEDLYREQFNKEIQLERRTCVTMGQNLVMGYEWHAGVAKLPMPTVEESDSDLIIDLLGQVVNEGVAAIGRLQISYTNR